MRTSTTSSTVLDQCESWRLYTSVIYSMKRAQHFRTISGLPECQQSSGDSNNVNDILIANSSATF